MHRYPLEVRKKNLFESDIIGLSNPLLSDLENSYYYDVMKTFLQAKLWKAINHHRMGQSAPARSHIKALLVLLSKCSVFKRVVM